MHRYYSSIYWHFVGSPLGIDWHRVRKPADILSQGGRPKSAEAGAEIVRAILRSQMLRATCTERIADGISTRRFCCVTDIPLKDLESHSIYYGNIAIGFRAGAVHKSFLPVLYYPSEQLPTVDAGFVGSPVKRWLSTAADRIEPRAAIDTKIRDNPFKDFLKITDFSAADGESFYGEREWRHVGSDFRFEPSDISAIVAPEVQLGTLRREWKRSSIDSEMTSFIAWEVVRDS